MLSRDYLEYKREFAAEQAVTERARREEAEKAAAEETQRANSDARVRQALTRQRQLELDIDRAEAISGPDPELPSTLKRFSDYCEFVSKDDLLKLTQDHFCEWNRNREAAGLPMVTVEEFKALIGPFCVENDLFPNVESYTYAYQRVKDRLAAVDEKWYPAPSAQELLSDKYRAIEAERPPFGLDSRERQLWERKQTERLLRVESAQRVDAIAAELNLSISPSQSEELWNRTNKGMVVDRARILTLLKQVCDLNPSEEARVDDDLRRCESDKYWNAGTGLPLR